MWSWFGTSYFSLFHLWISYSLFLQYYESLLIEAKSKLESAITEAVEKAVTTKMLDLKSELEKCMQEKDAVADVSSFIYFPSSYFTVFNLVFPLRMTSMHACFFLFLFSFVNQLHFSIFEFFGYLILQQLHFPVLLVCFVSIEE